MATVCKDLWGTTKRSKLQICDAEEGAEIQSELLNHFFPIQFSKSRERNRHLSAAGIYKPQTDRKLFVLYYGVTAAIQDRKRSPKAEGEISTTCEDQPIQITPSE